VLSPVDRRVLVDCVNPLAWRGPAARPRSSGDDRARLTMGYDFSSGSGFAGAPYSNQPLARRPSPYRLAAVAHISTVRTGAQGRRGAAWNRG